MQGNISNIQRFSVHDGYGIRTIVFLAGCGMQCAWCQNPEAIDSKATLMFTDSQCTSCGACVAICPERASYFQNGQVVVDRGLCKSCFACVKSCHFDARKPTNYYQSIDEVFNIVMRDEAFYRNSGGGLTLSGGEPLLQVEFATELVKRVQQQGVHTAIETAGYVPYSSLEAVLPFVDLFLFDLKLIDRQKHIEWTLVPNRIILENIKLLSQSDKEIILRVPLIPGVNDGDEFVSIVEFIRSLPSIREIHILPYHKMGDTKYDQMEKDNRMIDFVEENSKMVLWCKSYAEKKGYRVSIGGGGF